MSPIRILIADDHDVVRRGLVVFLKAFPDFELVGEARNGQEAIQQALHTQPDVVLMDVMMPKLNGVQATAHIMHAAPHIRILVLTSFQDRALVHDAVRAGAVGYVLKDAPIDDLADNIRAVYAGETALSAEATRALMQATRQPATVDIHLSPRESEILALLAEGLTNQQIATHLNISRSTVKFHVGVLLSKLDVASRTEAVAFALKNNLLPPR
ncbi:MAG: response regulator [Anaerolineales bacterium]